MYRSAQRRRRPARGRRPRRSAEESRNRLRTFVLLIISVLAVLGLRYANLSLLDQRLVHIRELPDSIVGAGFALSSDRELQIDIRGANQVRERPGGSGLINATLGNVWVIDAATKESVWDMRGASATGDAEGGLAYEGSIELPAGQYVLYCSMRAEEQRGSNGSWVSWLDADREMQSSGTEPDLGSDGFHVIVSGRGKQLSDREVVAALEAPAESAQPVEDEPARRTEPVRVRNTVTRDRRDGGVLADLTRLQNDEAKFAQFSLSRRTDVHVYAVGEGMDGEMYDYGWIVNTANGRTVWEMRYRDTEHAGGDGKNRFVDATISLGRGDYVVYFVTDESHSFDDWNARKPFDEEGWGITVAEAGSPDDRARVRIGDDNRWAPVAQLIDIRDHVRRRSHFSLDRRALVRVYALGEGDRTGMYDYAWIEDSETHHTVWEMQYRNTEHAGGNPKNRLVDSTGWLPAGEYVLRYRSDDSHSPESWNAEPPDDIRNYGVTVFVDNRNR